MQLKHVDLSEYSKVKQFTHDDLDGVGSAIMGYNVCELNGVLENYSFELCTYSNINSNINTYLEENYDEYGNPTKENAADFILITDIGISDEIAEKLDVLYEAGIGLLMVDHHAKNKYLDENYEWINVIHKIDGKLTSATSLLAEMLILNHENTSKFHVDLLQKLVRSYDTWDWERTGDYDARDLNTFLYFIGKESFFNRFKGVNKRLEYTSFEKDVIDKLNQKRERYIEKALTRLNVVDVLDYKVAFVFAEEHISELGNVICKTNKDIDFAVIINMASELLSLRAVKESIDVGDFAKTHLLGGGHKPAAGAQVPMVFSEIKKVFPNYMMIYGKDTPSNVESV